jgi:magnesium-protoporphyrin IX monomethyl ester (oxidative) cyclase
VILNVAHPDFFRRLDVAAAANARLGKTAASNQPKLLQWLTQIPQVATIGWQMVQLYLLKPTDVTATRGQVH